MKQIDSQRHSKFFSYFIAFVLAFAAGSTFAAEKCSEAFFALLDGHDKARPMAQSLSDWADEKGLNKVVVEVGPPERRVKRLMVPIDVTDWKLHQEYRKKFQLDDSPGKGVDGVLPLEFQREVENEYVTGVVRPGTTDADKIYRWGRDDLTYKDWWGQWMKSDSDYVMNPRKNVVGYAHLIPLTKDEVANFKHFIKNPDLRAPCKSDNCVAWTSSIELGKTAKGATDEERRFLLPELGVKRSMAHFEIGRRLMNATNQRHSSVVVFVKGKEGMKNFLGAPEKHLVPDPKIPYSQILKGAQIDLKKDLEDAIALIPDGAKVFSPIAAGSSPEGLHALLKRAETMKKGFDLHTLVNGVSAGLFEDAAKGDKLRLHALFLGGNMRKVYKEGRVKVIPGYLADFPRLMRDPTEEAFQYDAIIVRVSPKDAKGMHSLGPNHDMIMDILEARPNIKIIAEINENVPVTKGTNKIAANKITASFVDNSELAGPPVVPLGDVEKDIGKNLAGLVPNGATIQLGIGNIFGGLPSGLKAKRVNGLNISTEMFGDPMKEMMEMGIADRAETGFAYGSGDLYKWLHKNNEVTFKGTREVNHIGKVMDTENFHAINTEMQVDLRGQVNATFGPDGKRISSPGGQVEFMTGAARSQGGKAIIAIRSTAKNGEISSIALKLYEGAITTPAESVTHVVTEYGVATLKGKSESERVIELINVAHPKFRARLKREARAADMISVEEAKLIKKN